jgi:hypothetical protein
MTAIPQGSSAGPARPSLRSGRLRREYASRQTAPGAAIRPPGRCGWPHLNARSCGRILPAWRPAGLHWHTDCVALPTPANRWEKEDRAVCRVVPLRPHGRGAGGGCMQSWNSIKMARSARKRSMPRIKAGWPTPPCDPLNPWRREYFDQCMHHVNKTAATILIMQMLYNQHRGKHDRRINQYTY